MASTKKAARPRARKASSIPRPNVRVARAKKKPKKLTKAVRITRHLGQALVYVEAARKARTTATGFRLLIDGYEHLMLAACLARSAEDVYRVAQARKVASAAALSMIKRCP